jgi:hypothetical protein
MSQWTWYRTLRLALADALRKRIDEAYVNYVGSLIKPDGTPVPILDRINAVASIWVLPWLFKVGGYIAIARVPDEFANVMSLKDLASLIGGICYESENVVLVDPSTLADFLSQRITRLESLLAQSSS